MATAPPDPAAAPDPPPAAWREFARAPLVPVALAATAGLVLDRYAGVSFAAWLWVAAGGLTAWGVANFRGTPAAAWLWVAAAGVAGGHHHAHRHHFDPDDIATFAADRPSPARLRGTLDDEPTRHSAPKPDPLRTTPAGETTGTVLAVTAVHTPDGWAPASGRARLTVEGRLDGLHHGDVVEVTGRLSRPGPPANPGEIDFRSRLLDQRTTAVVRAGPTAEAVTRLEEGWRGSLFGWLAVVRGWGARALQEHIPPPESGVATALLLGDGSAMDRAEWDRYVRTGVVHVLAISGQHLVILAWFAWLALRVVGVRRRHGAWAVAALVIGYALLTGGRPSAVRAAVMVGVVCGGIVLRRPVLPANAFALAWLVVVAANPTDPFTAGCQLSFLSVFVLVWGVGPLIAPRPPDPLEQLVEESRTLPEKAVRWLARLTLIAHLFSLTLGVANAPLILAWQNLVSPVGILAGPPLVVLTAVALLGGFVLMLVAPFGALAVPLALVARWSLWLCDVVVKAAETVPGAWVHAPAPPTWWLAGFYALLAATVLLAGPQRRKALAALAAWAAFGVAFGSSRDTADELRITFLSVGHGGCGVLETPDGRVLLYDAGTIGGPDVARRTIAPFLWHRGISRIDEVFVSHADLDHFNGLPDLLARFPVGRVTLTPSFAEKPSPGVAATLAALDRANVPPRVATAGDQFAAGDVSFEVLHPPPDGPAGNENARSLVLLVRHAGHVVLLTGDLEGAGQAMVMRKEIPPADVMLAPHHGSAGANSAALAAWARPKLVVSSQRPRDTAHLDAAYRPAGAAVWDTATAGAVTVRSHRTGLAASTFRTGETAVVRRGR